MNCVSRYRKELNRSCKENIIPNQSVSAMFRILRFSVMSSSRQQQHTAGGGRRAAYTLNHLNTTIANRKISLSSSSASVFQYPTNQYRMMSGTSSTSKSKCPSTGKYYMNVMYIVLIMHNSFFSW